MHVPQNRTAAVSAQPSSRRQTLAWGFGPRRLTQSEQHCGPHEVMRDAGRATIRTPGPKGEGGQLAPTAQHVGRPATPARPRSRRTGVSDGRVRPVVRRRGRALPLAVDAWDIRARPGDGCRAVSSRADRGRADRRTDLTSAATWRWATEPAAALQLRVHGSSQCLAFAGDAACDGAAVVTAACPAAAWRFSRSATGERASS